MHLVNHLKGIEYMKGTLLNLLREVLFVCLMENKKGLILILMFELPGQVYDILLFEVVHN